MVALTRRLVAFLLYLGGLTAPIGFLFHYWAYRAERKAPDIEPIEWKAKEKFKWWLFDVFDFDPDRDSRT